MEAIEPKKIEDRINFYLWTAPKVELFVSPAFIQTNKPFHLCLQEYLEECPYSKAVYTEFLLGDPTVLATDDTYRNVREVCSKAMSELITGCRFSVMFPNNLNLKENTIFSRLWRDLFIGYCIEFETFLHAKDVATELLDTGAIITAVVINALQITQINKGEFPILPTERIILRNFSAVCDKELESLFTDILPVGYQLVLSFKPNELLMVSNKLHFLFARGICFYLSRHSTDTEALSDVIRPLGISLREAGQLIHNGYDIASISLYEKTHFTDMLHLIDVRYSVNPPPKRVAIFGRRSAKPEEPAYKMAYEIALGVAARGYRVITGGYVGIMEAANSGAKQGEENGSNKELSEGVLCPSLFSSRFKGNDSLDRRYVKHGINQRTDMLVEESSVFVVMPGSIGTFTELLVGASMSSIDSKYHIPGLCRACIACRDPWQSVLENAWKSMDAPGYQIGFIEYFDTAQEAIDLVEKKYEMMVQSAQH